MNEFIVTFGQKYRRESHPKADYVHPDGYVTIEASDAGKAGDAAFKEFGNNWSHLYLKDQAKLDLYPRGELKRIVVKD